MSRRYRRFASLAVIPAFAFAAAQLRRGQHHDRQSPGMPGGPKDRR
ncbi:hypothetical protein ACFSTC_16530 [Nonomuraea ferruginea]